jgi:branched-chain amino acid transport system ATP-binding protein
VLLRVVDCSISYGKALAVDKVSIEVEDDSICCLIGANGSGKSSIMKAISGLVPISTGEIWFGERRIDGMHAQDIVRIGISQVPEGRRLFPYMSVQSNLEMGASTRKDKKGIKTDMERVFGYFPRLKDRRRQLAGTLSGGEQQMLAIARGLMGKPRLLLLDEPSVGLAPLLIAEVKEVVRTLNQEGITILLVEQNASLALGISDHGYVMQVGRVVLGGPIDELRQTEAVKKAYLG